MPIGEDDIMFEESWTSPTVLLDNATTSINEADLDEKASPLSTTSTVFTDAAKLQCPICRRILPSKEFGQCIGAPTSEFPVLRDQNGMTSRKRKRTESRTAHETRSAPCHDCLDNLGEEEGETWGRCDNPNCWSRGDQAKLRMSGPFADEDDYPFFGRSMLRPTPSSFVLRPRPQSDRPANPNKHKLGLVCPQCSPEGGLGCSHKWICDVCAFWEKQPLVWECPGCLNDYCDECEEGKLLERLTLERERSSPGDVNYVISLSAPPVFRVPLRTGGSTHVGTAARIYVGSRSPCFAASANMATSRIVHIYFELL
ncbi:hypothetical protein EV360DRAFT_72035 [Lentinula raphanica]|nr:hypothetical protein EV360DRAFT_72035 [Lentinula raphanica]